jgi:hypothetical protein
MAQAKVRRMFEVQSNMIHKLGFDMDTPGAGTGYLVVQFANLDAYGYADVTWRDYLTLLNAVSVGNAFNEIVKLKYKGVKLGVTDTHVVGEETLKAKAQKATKEAKDDLPMLDVMGDEPKKVTSKARKK